MLPNWLTTLFDPKPAPVLSAIFIATGAGKPMQAVTTVNAIQDLGLMGDRYHNDSGHWQLIEGCQVTLITEHELLRAQKRTDITLDDGSHRRNLVIAGVKPGALQDKQFRVGEALFAYEKPRPPCGYIDRVAGEGMGKALSHNSGICIRVVQSGMITVGDTFEIVE